MAIKKRRLQGEGGIHKWRGYLVATVELPRGADGKRKRKKLYAKTAAELAEKRRAYEIEKGLSPDAEKLRVGELLDRWLQSSATSRLCGCISNLRLATARRAFCQVITSRR
jgi:hypothetical protein